jgi:8-oxo-dGTP pyrophosphatase MutT (NUDIX family)
MQKTHVLIVPLRQRKLKQRGSGNKQISVMEVCVITSRGKGQWIVPKGWRKRKVSDQKLAKIEAFEEAGVKGSARLEHSDLTLRVVEGTKKRRFKVYVMLVIHEFPSWPEKHQRKRCWLQVGGKRMNKSIRSKKLCNLIVGCCG